MNGHRFKNEKFTGKRFIEVGRICKAVTMPFIFSPLYMLKLNRSIADTSRQSYMRMIDTELDATKTVE